MTITFILDGEETTSEEGKTLLEAAREHGKDVPTICFHDATTANALCRICLVEVEGMRVLQPACIVQAASNMKVQTRSEKVDRAPSVEVGLQGLDTALTPVERPRYAQR